MSGIAFSSDLSQQKKIISNLQEVEDPISRNLNYEVNLETAKIFFYLSQILLSLNLPFIISLLFQSIFIMLLSIHSFQ